jgi:hypothetical protein
MAWASPLIVQFSETAAEFAGVVSWQGMADDVQDAAEFDRVGAAGEDAAAGCRVEEPVVRVAQEARPGVKGFTCRAGPEPGAFEACDRGAAARAEAGEVGSGLVKAAVCGGADLRR